MSDENTKNGVKPTRIILGKSLLCTLTIFSGALDKKHFDGNTTLLKISEENNKHKYVYIGGDMVCSFMTSENFYENISNMGNNICPYILAMFEENCYLLAPHFKFVKKDKIDYDTILDGVYANEIISFEKLDICKVHSNYDD